MPGEFLSTDSQSVILLNKDLLIWNGTKKAYLISSWDTLFNCAKNKKRKLNQDLMQKKTRQQQTIISFTSAILVIITRWN